MVSDKTPASPSFLSHIMCEMSQSVDMMKALNGGVITSICCYSMQGVSLVHRKHFIHNNILLWDPGEGRGGSYLPGMSKV